MLSVKTISIFFVLMISSASLISANQSVDVAACASGNWVTCGISLGSFVFDLLTWHDGGSFPLLGHTCDISVKGRISHFHLVYDGRVKCPFGQEAESKGWKSSHGAAEEATKKFFLINSDLINSMQNQTISN